MKNLIYKKIYNTMIERKETTYQSNIGCFQNNKLIVTKIKNIGNISLAPCIKRILNNNNSIVISKIEYFPETKQINFITTNKIDVDCWENRYLYDENHTQEERFNWVVNSNIEKDEDLISLYELYNTIRNQREEYYERLNIVKTNIMVSDTKGLTLQSDFPRLYLDDFDEINKILYARYEYKKNKYAYYKLKRDSNNIIIIDGDKSLAPLLHKYNDLLLDYFQISEEMIKFDKNTRVSLKSINIPLNVEIVKEGINVYFYDTTTGEKIEVILNNCELAGIYSYKNKISADFFIKKGIDVIALIDKIYLRVDDCPETIKSDICNKYNCNREKIKSIIKTKN